MIKLGEEFVRTDQIIAARIDTRQYANGCASWLHVTLEGGRILRVEHGPGFDAFAMLEKIREVVP